MTDAIKVLQQSHGCIILYAAELGCCADEQGGQDRLAEVLGQLRENLVAPTVIPSCSTARCALGLLWLLSSHRAAQYLHTSQLACCTGVQGG